MLTETDGATVASDRPPSRTVFRAFERGEFIEWSAWLRLREILASNGGSYGLSGPRGAGKSWLMRRAIDDARDPEDPRRSSGIGLWYPSPSEYDPHAFLASLSESLVNEIDRRFRQGHPLRHALGRGAVASTVVGVVALGIVYAAFPDRFSATQFIALAVAILGVGAIPRMTRSRGPLIGASLALVALVSLNFAFPTRLDASLTIALVVVTIGLVVVPTVVQQALRPETRLLREAKVVRERARYTSTRRESSEIGAEGGRGLVARIGRARARELVERPATLSTLVNDFRTLAEQAGQLAGRIVIAVDELDKMDDPDKVRALLRDIKGIFEVPNVHFLVSVSEEAARNLNLGALTGRSEFNSSFYTVIELPPLSPDACAELLALRADVPADVARALGVLAGGIPREVLRLAEFVGRGSMPEAVITALKEEALTLRREIVTAQDIVRSPEGEALHRLGHDSRVGAFRSLPEAAFEGSGPFAAFAGNVLDSVWNPPWADEAWRYRFEEPWRRLLMRLAVGQRLVTDGVSDDGLLRQLRDVVMTASQSAAVARIVFEEEIRVETRASA